MKMRIKGNSIRIRLTRTEVSAISKEGYIEEQTHFANGIFKYALKTSQVKELDAILENNSITMFVPESFVKNWPENDITGLESIVQAGSNVLSLLLEKDFVCLDETTEDQSDNYVNPNKTC